MTELDKIISFAIKWWGDQIDGTHDRLAYEKGVEILEKYKDIKSLQDLHDYYELKEIKESLDAVENYRKKEDIYVLQEQRRRFELQLEKYIKRDLTERKVAYLYTEDDGSAGGILGLATHYSGIRNEGDKEGEPSPFPKNIEMFVSENSIDIKYEKDGSFITIYEIESENN